MRKERFDSKNFTRNKALEDHSCTMMLTAPHQYFCISIQVYHFILKAIDNMPLGILGMCTRDLTNSGFCGSQVQDLDHKWSRSEVWQTLRSLNVFWKVDMSRKGLYILTDKQFRISNVRKRIFAQCARVAPGIRSLLLGYQFSSAALCRLWNKFSAYIHVASIIKIKNKNCKEKLWREFFKLLLLNRWK